MSLWTLGQMAFGFRRAAKFAHTADDRLIFQAQEALALRAAWRKVRRA